MSEKSMAQVRKCVNAIVTDDAQALYVAWKRAMMPQTQASALIMQAWRADVAENRQGLRMCHGGLLNAAYVALVDQSRRTVSSAITSPEGNAGMLIASTAIQNDDDALLAVMVLWIESFMFVQPNGDGTPDDVYQVGEVMRLSGAPKCAAHWHHLQVDRAAGDVVIEDEHSTVQISKIIPPSELSPIMGTARLSVTIDHAAYERPAVLALNPLKTIFVVQFDLLPGAAIDTSTTSGKLAARDLRAKAQEELARQRFTVLELCNMRVAVYDNGRNEEAFVEAATAAAAVAGLAVNEAERVIDPGPGLIVVQWNQEPFFLMD